MVISTQQLANERLEFTNAILQDAIYCYNLCNNESLFFILIGRELWVITSWITTSDGVYTSAKCFRRFSTRLFKLLLHKTNRFHILCFCTVIDHSRRHCVRRTKSHGTRFRFVPYLFCFSHAMTSSVIYYITDAQKIKIHLLSTI